MSNICGTSIPPQDLRAHTIKPYAYKANDIRPKKKILENCCLCYFSAYFKFSENRIFVRKEELVVFIAFSETLRKSESKEKYQYRIIVSV